jgi:hypothetical protein
VRSPKEEAQIVSTPIQHEEWPEDFWQAFEGMSEDFERPPQVPTRSDLRTENWVE